MNIRKTWHRFISMLLVFVMVLSIAPLNLFQSEESLVAYGYTGDGTGETAMTGGGAWRANWTTDKQGVRFTIVDQDMNIVMKNYDAVDVVFSDPGIFGADGIEILESTKFQEPGVDNNIMRLSIGALQNALITAIEDQDAVDKEFLSHLKGTLQIATTNFPKDLKTMPQPILQSAGNPATGNGDNVKAFFIDGALGSYTQSGYALGINKPHFTLVPEYM